MTVRAGAGVIQLSIGHAPSMAWIESSSVLSSFNGLRTQAVRFSRSLRHKIALAAQALPYARALKP